MTIGFRPFLRSAPLANFRREMDRLVGDFFGPIAAGIERSIAPSAGYPSLNVWEEGETLYAEAEVPGLKADDLEICIVSDQLTIKGRRSDDRQNGSYHRRERGIGEFVRTVTLPAEINAEKVEAALSDGVLRITLPRAESAKPRKVTVARS